MATAPLPPVEQVRPGVWSIPVPMPDSPLRYGLAGRVREASGAWVALHPADAALIPERYEQPEELCTRMAATLTRWGAPPEEPEGLAMASMASIGLVALVKPDVLLEDGDKPEVPGWDISAIWTPGH